MKQRLPDFFLITDAKKRSDAELEYMNDHKLNRRQFERLYEDQIQLSGETLTRRLLSAIAEKNLHFNETLLVNIVAEMLKSDKKVCKTLLDKIKKEREIERELNKARKKITKTIYRTFKETLCPV